jgi:competence protein CoiA
VADWYDGFIQGMFRHKGKPIVESTIPAWRPKPTAPFAREETRHASESEAHRRCKTEIFKALQNQPGVHKLMLERPLGTNRPDVSAEINGVRVAVEVQISSLLPETIQRRTIEYARKGIYVLWLLQWTPKLDGRRYSPALWEKWIHAAYFGRVYYWIEGLTVLSYHFDTNHRTVPKKSWYAEDGKKLTAGGYSRRSKRYRTATRGEIFNIARDFAPRERYWWEGNGIKVPDAKLFMDGHQRFIPHEEIGTC